MMPISVLTLILWCTNARAFLTSAPSTKRSSKMLRTLCAVSEKTRKIFDSIDLSNTRQTGGAGGSTTLDGLLNLDRGWSKLRDGGWSVTPDPIVFEHYGTKHTSATSLFDVVVCGGTLGVFYAAALQTAGYKTCIVERGKVVGRQQEWNISKKELLVLVRLGLLTTEDISTITSIEFNPVRVGFKTDTSAEAVDKGFEVYVRDILNLGIRPDILIDLVKKKYEAAGGVVLEGVGASRLDVFDNAVDISLTDGNHVAARLVMDAMGNASPISKQTRGAVEPDGICIVVGSCARGFDASNNTYSDVIYTDTPVTHKSKSSLQYFWEAFPAGSGPTDRTTYLFTYMDAKKDRPSVQEIIDDYWELLPRYQGVNVDELEYLRILYGLFPTYRDSPVKSRFNRILAVGDASGIQSPLSFGGFGSLTRHIERIIGAVDEALVDELLDADQLSLVNPYQPNLSACWMFQRAMSCQVGSSPRPEEVVSTLQNSFSAMEKLGPSIITPFLQDVLQFWPLLRTLSLAFAQDLLTPIRVVPHVGVTAIADFLKHFIMLAVYTALSSTLGPVLEKSSESWSDPELRFRARRTAEAWKFGSGLDYYDH